MQAGDGSILEAINDLIGKLKGKLSASATDKRLRPGQGRPLSVLFDRKL
jgi:hypothetical protein